MRILPIAALKLSAIVLLAGCGGPRSAPFSGVKAASLGANLAAVNYSSWCTAWSLACPAQPEPSSPKALTKQQWTSLVAIAQAIGTSPTQLTVTSGDLDQPALTSAVTALHMTAKWSALRQRLSEIKFADLSLGHGAVVISSDSPTRKSAASGLQISTEASIGLSVGADLGIAVKGLTLGSASGSATSTLDSLVFNGDGTVDWQGSELSVAQTPLSFISREILGVTPPVSPAGVQAEVGLKDLIPLIVPLSEWLDAGGLRTIDLGREQIAAVAPQVQVLVKDAQTRSALQPFLDRIQTVRSSRESRVDHLFHVESSSEIRCKIDDKIEFVLGTDFGLGHVSRSDGTDDTLVSLEVEGFQVTLPGPFPLPVAISRIELSPTKLFVRDLPLIGSIGIDLPAPTTAPSSGGQVPAPALKIDCY